MYIIIALNAVLIANYLIFVKISRNLIFKKLNELKRNDCLGFSEEKFSKKKYFIRKFFIKKDNKTNIHKLLSILDLRTNKEIIFTNCSDDGLISKLTYLKII